VTAPTRAPLRVLHLRDSPWLDGPGRTILETGAHIDGARVEFHIGAFVSDPTKTHPLVDTARARGIRVHGITDYGNLDGLVGRIVKLVDEHRIDLLHSSELRSNLAALLVRRRRRGLRVVATAHGWIANDLRGRIYRIADKVLLRLFDRVVFVSQAIGRRVPRWWLGARRRRVLLNALVLESYGKEILSRTRAVPDPARAVTVLNVGRLSAEKGQDLLLRAVAALVPEFPGVRLQFAGIGPLESALRALANELGIAQRVEFLGYIADMPKLYSEVDLVVQSSLTEGLPNVILEAAYLRVPIVATSVGGTDEVVAHGRSAWLLRPGSLAELTAGLREYLRRPADFVAMGEAAHRYVREHFSFQARTDGLMALYDELRAERP
jgi:glycosyltransferase involved in cell wall biosynthesis